MHPGKWLRLRIGPEPAWKVLEEWGRNASSKPAVRGLLQIAQRIAKSRGHTESYRNSLRRFSRASPDEISQLLELAWQVGKVSLEAQYCLLLATQAAAVKSCGPAIRYDASIALALCADALEEYEQARYAYLDALESLRILVCYYEIDEAWAASVEADMLKVLGVLARLTSTKRGLHGASPGDVAGEWLKLVEWNTDRSPYLNDVIDQLDATQRLTLRLQRQLAGPDNDLARCIVCYADLCCGLKDRALASSYLITLGDSLITVGLLKEALYVHSRVFEQNLVKSPHVLHSHAVLQSAYCQLKLNDRNGCIATMERLNCTGLSYRKGSSYLSERARYVALEVLLGPVGRKLPDDDMLDLRNSITVLFSEMKPKAKDRRGYLCNLHYYLHSRDIDSAIGDAWDWIW